MPQTDIVASCGMEMASETRFYIPATDAPARPRRNLKHDNTFAVFDSHGDIGVSAGGEDGLFDFDTRYLSHLELLIDGSRPLLLHSSVEDDNLSYAVDLTNADIYSEGRLSLAKDTLHISRTIYLRSGALRERMTITSHGPAPVSFILTISFANDFADIFEVRGIRRPRRGKSWSEVVGPDMVRLNYDGLDGESRRTNLLLEPVPTSLSTAIATFMMTLAPRERKIVFVSASNSEQMHGTRAVFFRERVELTRAQRMLARGAATVETANPVVNDILCRSMADLRMLTTATEDGPYPYAGIPWYSTTFGRDGLITALEMLWLNPGMAKGVLTRLARFQATSIDKATDAAPGKILHEMRSGEMAHLNEVPFRQYYGTVDATPLFVMLAGAYGKRTGNWSFVSTLWNAIESALSWINDVGDSDGDGFIEYARGAETGLANQGWKDSHDSIFHADGSLARGPIALVEVQGYAYAARRAAAACARAIGKPERAVVLDASADRLRLLFEDSFWCEDLNFYALALDGDKAPCRVLSSNVGHALWSGIMAPHRAAAVGSKLLDSDFFSGWGVRTVAIGASRYNPMSYHNGSIWPHDNALIARGLDRIGSKDGIIAIFEALMRAATYFDLKRIPELYCGFRRRPRRGPVLYPAACAPQAWAAAAPFSLIESMLGLEFLPAEGEIRLNHPIVAPLAGAITLRNVRLGPATADFTVRSSPGGAAVEVLRTSGDVRISLVA